VLEHCALSTLTTSRMVFPACPLLVVLACHCTHTYTLVTGSPIVLSPPNTVLSHGESDR
jgi:hypothetical protein